MKKKIVFSLCILLCNYIFATEFLVSKQKCYGYNSTLQRQFPATFEIHYESELDYFFLKSDVVYIRLNEDELEIFRNAIDKYLEWEEIAVSNKKEIEKLIPYQLNNAFFIWTYNADSCLGEGMVYFSFLSQNVTLHQMVISTSKVHDITGTYYVKMNDIYMDKEDVLSLKNNLSKKYLNSKKEEFKKRKDDESLFN